MFFSFLCLFWCLSSNVNIISSLTVDEIDEAYELWNNNGYDSYVFTFQWNCFCFTCYYLEKLVQVTDLSITSVSFSDDTDASNAQCDDSWLTPSSYKTVSELFDMLYENVETAASIRASFDPDLGYPTSAFIDFNERMADEERGWDISILYPQTEISSGCNDDTEAILSIERQAACSDFIVSVSESGGSVCVALEGGETGPLLVVFESYSGYEMEKIWLWVGDDLEDLPMARRNIVRYSSFDYISEGLTDTDRTIYKWEISLDVFDSLSDICDYCGDTTIATNSFDDTLQLDAADLDPNLNVDSEDINLRVTLDSDTPTLYLQARVKFEDTQSTSANNRYYSSYIEMEVATDIDCFSYNQTGTD